MASFADNLSRLRVAVTTGNLPPDLGQWAVDQLEDLGPRSALVAARNARLREAAALLTGSTWARATRLQREIEAIDRETASPDGVRALVARALEAAPAPASIRQLFRIIDN